MWRLCPLAEAPMGAYVHSTAHSPSPSAEAASPLTPHGLHGRNHYCNEKPRNVFFPALGLLLTQNGCQAYK